MPINETLAKLIPAIYWKNSGHDEGTISNCKYLCLIFPYMLTNISFQGFVLPILCLMLTIISKADSDTDSGNRQKQDRRYSDPKARNG